MEILLIITERPDRLALHVVGRLPPEQLEHREQQLPKDSRSTWTAHYTEQRWTNNKCYDTRVDYEWVYACFGMRFSALVHLRLAEVQLHVADSGPCYRTSPWPTGSSLLTQMNSDIHTALFILHTYSHASDKSFTGIIEHFILNVEGKNGHFLQSPCAWLCASYTGVKTSAFHHHTVKNKGWAPSTQNAEISWNETRPLATGNRAPQCPVSCKREGKINLSLFSSAFNMIHQIYPAPAAGVTCVRLHT